MGHIRLGELPRSRKWERVVELLKDDGDLAAVAAATLWFLASHESDLRNLSKTMADETVAAWERFRNATGAASGQYAATRQSATP